MQLILQLIIWYSIVSASIVAGVWLRIQFSKDVKALQARQWNGARMIQAEGGRRRETIRLVAQATNLSLAVFSAFMPAWLAPWLLIFIALCFGGNTVLDALQRKHLREAIRRERT